MSGTPILDPRSREDILAQVVDHARSYTPEWRCDGAEDDPGAALAALFCDMESVRMETLPGTATYIAGGSYYVLDPAGVAETVNNCCNPYEQGIAVSDLSIRVG